MVAWYDNLVSVWKLGQPFIEVADCGTALAEPSEVTSMYEYVAVGDIEFPVKFMGVGDADNSGFFQEAL